MRSSSSGAGVLGADFGGLSDWQPENLTAKRPTAPTPREIDAMIAEALAEAVEAERAAAAARESELVRRADEQREAAVREAYERGFDEGRADGEIGEAARLRTAVRAAEEALDGLRAGEIRWSGTIEENVCALAVVIARQIIDRELEADIAPVANLVRAALDDFPIDQPIRIRINPNDLNALGSVNAIEADPLRGITGDRDARWLPDASIAPGGCVVEGRERIIDGRVDTALERVYRRLTYTNA